MCIGDTMDYFTIILGAVVILYLLAYSCKSFMFLAECKRAELSGNVKECDGEIADKIDEKRKAIGGEMVSICYPKYKASVGGGELYYQSNVRRRDVKVGQAATMCYDENKGIVWPKDDIPLIKKQVLIRLVIVGALVLVFVLENVFL